MATVASACCLSHCFAINFRSSRDRRVRERAHLHLATLGSTRTAIETHKERVERDCARDCDLSIRRSAKGEKSSLVESAATRKGESRDLYQRGRRRRKQRGKEQK